MGTLLSRTSPEEGPHILALFVAGKASLPTPCPGLKRTRRVPLGRRPKEHQPWARTNACCGAMHHTAPRNRLTRRPPTERDPAANVNDIAVQLSWISSRLTARPQTCPERRSLPHRRRIKGKVVKSLRQQVKSADTRRTVQMQELATHFVVDNLWDDQAMPSAQHAR